MIRKRVSAFFSSVRHAFDRWREAGSAAAMLLLLIVGARIIAPDIDANALADFLRSGGSGSLVRLWDLLVGGALTRGGLLAIGIVPFLTARVYVRLATTAFPSFEELSRDRLRLQRWTRALTFGFALVQSYGFTRFLQSVPGVVSDPGIPFTLRTVALLTGSAMAVSWLSERISASREPDLSSDTGNLTDATPVRLPAPLPAESIVNEREAVRVNR